MESAPVAVVGRLTVCACRVVVHDAPTIVTRLRSPGSRTAPAGPWMAPSRWPRS